MNPSTLRAMLGQTLIPNVPGLSEATARYAVVGFGSDEIRVRDGHGHTSALTFAELDSALVLGALRIVDSPKP